MELQQEVYKELLHKRRPSLVQSHSLGYEHSVGEWLKKRERRQFPPYRDMWLSPHHQDRRQSPPHKERTVSPP